MNAVANAASKGPRFAGVPGSLIALASVLMLGLGGLLIYLAFDRWQEDEDCVDAELLSADECQELHGDLGTTLLIAGIAALALLLVALASLAIIGRRGRKRVIEDAPAPVAEDRGEAPVRICPVCSAQSKTHSDTCPHCGASFIRARRIRANRRVAGMSGAAKAGLVLVSLLVPLALAGGAYAVITVGDRDDEAEELAQAELEGQKAEAAEAAAQKEREAEQAERSLRQIQVRELEDTITKDAQKESERSFAIIEGPILDTQCDPEGGQVDTETVTQDFDCLAITKYNADGSARGYRYSATINYNEFSYRWRLGGGGL